jgi:hypothetical protein
MGGAKLIRFGSVSIPVVKLSYTRADNIRMPSRDLLSN